MKAIILVVLMAQAVILYGQPEKRNGVSIFYHPELKEIMVYGGSSHSRSSTKMRDSVLWLWNGVRWKFYTTAPSIRTNVVLCYDASTQKLILSAGSFSYSRENQKQYNDTWEYDGKDWKQTSSKSLPSHLFHTAGAFHPGTGSVILFGGYDATVDQLSNRTWMYKNANWIEKHTTKTPPPRNVHCMFTDPQTNGVVVVGGDNMTAEGLRDMWIFREDQWEVLATDMPFKFAGQYSATAIGKTGDYFFLNSSSHENISEAWLWRGSARRWEKVTSTPPSPRNEPGIAYDELRHCIVVFGGQIGIESTNEVWELNLTTQNWKKAFPK